VSATNSSGKFEQDLLPHLNSAYNLARWLTRNEQDAQDIVQEAYLRAFSAYRGFRTGNARPWLMKIVRNVFYTSLQRNSSHLFVAFDNELFASAQRSINPEQRLIEESNGLLVQKALEMLSTRSREFLLLREMLGMTYKEISNITNVPIGTVMSTLSRARARLRQFTVALSNEQGPR
jgi:RNA polymerase sigma factor (sigma-70 family)